MPQDTADRPLPNVSPLHARILLQAVADHFHLSANVCRRRSCRRVGACRGDLTRTPGAGFPPCLAGLDPQARDNRDRLLEMLEEIYRMIRWRQPSPDADTKWREETAIAIMQRALPRMPGRAAAFARWHADFIGPPIDTGALLAEVNAEIRLAKQDLAFMDLKARLRKGAGRDARDHPIARS